MSSVSMSLLSKVKSRMGNPDWYVLMISIYLQRLLMMLRSLMSSDVRLTY